LIPLTYMACYAAAAANYVIVRVGGENQNIFHNGLLFGKTIINYVPG
jgi:hypothetical protein